jgi:hypothetical protein
VWPGFERLLLDAFLERVRQQPFVDEAEREECLRGAQDRVVELLDSWPKNRADAFTASLQPLLAG